MWPNEYKIKTVTCWKIPSLLGSKGPSVDALIAKSVDEVEVTGKSWLIETKLDDFVDFFDLSLFEGVEDLVSVFKEEVP